MSARSWVQVLTILVVGAFGVHAIALLDPGSWYGGMTPQAIASERNRDSYVKENEGRFEEWGRRIDRFNEDAKRTGEIAQRAAAEKLQAAWGDVRRNWNALKSASKEGWSEATRSLEQSWTKLERAWEEARSKE